MDPTPTTIGELAIAMNLQFASVREDIRKLDDLPGRMVVLEHEVGNLKQRALDRRALWLISLGWLVTLLAGIAGVVIK